MGGQRPRNPAESPGPHPPRTEDVDGGLTVDREQAPGAATHQSAPGKQSTPSPDCQPLREPSPDRLTNDGAGSPSLPQRLGASSQPSLLEKVIGECMESPYYYPKASRVHHARSTGRRVDLLLSPVGLKQSCLLGKAPLSRSRSSLDKKARSMVEWFYD